MTLIGDVGGRSALDERQAMLLSQVQKNKQDRIDELEARHSHLSSVRADSKLSLGLANYTLQVCYSLANGSLTECSQEPERSIPG